VISCDMFSVKFANVKMSDRNFVFAETVNSEFKSTPLETMFSLWKRAFMLQEKYSNTLMLVKKKN
jgi:hypothetical protein